MRRNLAGISLLLFGLSIVFLLALTLFESALVGMSPGAERLLSFLLLVVPAGVGVILGVISLTRREGQAWLAIAGIVLNALYALFHLLVLLFAG
jgi:hypothetical protein